MINKPNIIYWNCASGIFNKIDIIKHKLTEHKPDVLILAEADLNLNMNLKVLEISGYNFATSLAISSERKSRICVYYKNSWTINEQYMSKHDEIVILERGELSVIGIYRPFKLLQGETATTNFERLLAKIEQYIEQNRHKKLIILGDFNVDYLKFGDVTYQRHNLADQLLDFQIRNGLGQQVNEITRHQVIRNNNGTSVQTSRLDHVYINFTGLDPVEILPSISSDHDVIKVTIDELDNTTKIKTETTFIRDWRRYSREKLLEVLSKENWEIINNTNDITTLNDRLEQSIKKATDLVAPWKSIKIRGNKFITDLNLQDKQRKRDRSYAIWKKNPTPENHSNLKKLNLNLRCHLKTMKHKAVSRNLNTNNPKQFWKTVNLELGKNTRQKLQFMTNNKLESNPARLAEIYKDSMIQKLKNNEAKLGHTNIVDNSRKIPELELYENEGISWSKEQVTNVIKAFKKKLSTGHDDIPVVIYQDSLEYTITALTKLFNSIAHEKRIPDAWRLAKIKPTYKKGSKTMPENYRPISNIVTISKIYKKLILEYVNELEAKSGVLLSGNHQHGFMRNRSTTTAGLVLQSKLAELLERGSHVLLYSTDLSAAFDMLNPNLFKLRMTNLGIPKALTNILHDYISERQAYVEIDGATSEVFDITLGCVQGSVIGPMIFSIFMRPMNELDIDINSYADDTCGILPIDPQDDVLPIKIRTHLNWLKDSGMLVNEDKTEMMVMHKTNKILKDYIMNGVTIKTKRTMNILGVIFNQNLTWSDHVFKTINSCQSVLHGLKILRKYFSLKDFTKLMTTYLFSKLFYAIEIWHFDLLSFNCKSKITSFYYTCCRLIVKDFERIQSRHEIDTQVKRATPKEFSNYCVARTVINAIHCNMSPLNQICLSTSFQIQRKPGQIFFFDNSRLKVGKNKLNNRLTWLFNEIKKPWLNLSKNQTRILLKKTFFKYGDI